MVLHNVLVSAVAEGSVGAELAVTDLVVAALVDVEIDRSVSGDQVVAHGVTPWALLGNSASTEPVDLKIENSTSQNFLNKKEGNGGLRGY